MSLNSTLTILVISLASTFTAESNYRALEIQRFEVPSNIGLPAEFSTSLQADLVSEITRKKVFAQVYSAEPTAANTEKALRLTGRITEFKEGSRAMRYMVGFGAGKRSSRRKSASLMPRPAE